MPNKNTSNALIKTSGNKSSSAKRSPAKKSPSKPSNTRNASVKTAASRKKNNAKTDKDKEKIPIDKKITEPQNIQSIKPTARFDDIPDEKSKTSEFLFQITPFIIFVAAVFFGVCIFFDGAMGVVGGFIRSITLGLFSGGAFTIPFFMVYHALFWHSDEISGILRRKLVCSLITLVQISILMQVFTSDIPKIWNPVTLYNLGLEHKGGGAIGGFLGTLLMSCFGIIGTLIIVIAALFILLLSMMNITPKSLWTYILYKLKMAKMNYFKARDEKRRLAEEAEEAAACAVKSKPTPMYDTATQSATGTGIGEVKIKTAPAPASRYKVTRRPKFNTDIPLDVTGSNNSDKQKNATNKEEIEINEQYSENKSSENRAYEINEIGNVIDEKIFEEEMARINREREEMYKKSENGENSDMPNLQEAYIVPEEDDYTATIDSVSDDSENNEKFHADNNNNGNNMIITDEVTRIFDKVISSKIKPERTPADVRAEIENIADDEFNLDNYTDENQNLAQTEDNSDNKEIELSVERGRIIERLGQNTVSHSVPRPKNPKLPETQVIDEVSQNVENTEPDETEVVPPPEYVFPPIDLLTKANEAPADIGDELKENAVKLVETLRSFHVKTKIVDVSRGPTITRYELVPEAGTRVRSIANLVDDIALNLATTGVRIEAPIPGKSAVGIEVPNKKPETVHLRSLIENDTFINSPSRITASLGADVGGAPVYLDIAKMPHLLIAGATGMGKSVCINSLIVSLLYKAKPDEVKLILIDPKKVELNIYNGLPHLLVPVVSDPKKAAGSLAWAVSEMERRFELIEDVGVRDIKNYNIATKDDPDKEFLPQVVIIIDELADLMMTASDEVEESICRLAQKARAAGMHMIIGTQRPSVDVITGLIKANIPSRIAFTVASQIDSRTIIDTAGAEKLIGRGDMLYAPVGASKPIRVQGAFVSESDVEKITSFIKEHCGESQYSDEVIDKIEKEAEQCGIKPGKRGAGGGAVEDDGENDPMLRSAIELAVESGKISTSLIQRRLSLGYGRAAKLIDRMQELGYVSPPEGQKPRKVLITKQQYMEMVLRGEDGIE